MDASPVIGEATASVEPRKGTLDHPAAGQDNEALDIRTLHGLDSEAVEMRDGSCQFRPGIAAIGDEAGQRGIGILASFDEVRCAVTILDVGGIDEGVEKVAGRVGRGVTLAPLEA